METFSELIKRKMENSFCELLINYDFLVNTYGLEATYNINAFENFENNFYHHRLTLCFTNEEIKTFTKEGNTIRILIDEIIKQKGLKVITSILDMNHIVLYGNYGFKNNFF